MANSDDVMEIKERLTRIEVLLSEKVGQLENRVAKLEGNQRWLVIIILGAVVTAVMKTVGLY